LGTKNKKETQEYAAGNSPVTEGKDLGLEKKRENNHGQRDVETTREKKKNCAVKRKFALTRKQNEKEGEVDRGGMESRIRLEQVTQPSKGGTILGGKKKRN